VLATGANGGGGTGSEAPRDVLHASLRAIAVAGRGALVYLRPELGGDALETRLGTMRRPGAHDPGADTPDLTRPSAEEQRRATVNDGPMRAIGIGGQILRELGLSKLRLLTNRPMELPGIEAFGLEVVERVAVGSGAPG
jgi:3,4-dihydroxy 2-butanone 4-phosphate synthase/GTP cyclohydrolase II